MVVTEDQLSLAIGKHGQNVRLASELSGWNIELMSIVEEKERRHEEVAKAQAIFQEGLDMDADFAAVLVNEGFFTLEELAYCAQEDIIGVEGLDEEVAQELQKRARNVLLDQALRKGEEEGEGEVKISLLDLAGMTREIAEQMTVRDMVTVSALADAAVDEIEDIEGLSREQAEALIITAREASGWFD